MKVHEIVFEALRYFSLMKIEQIIRTFLFQNELDSTVVAQNSCFPRPSSPPPSFIGPHEIAIAYTVIALVTLPI